MMPAWMLWEVQYDLICSEMIVYTLWPMAILPTREHLKMHAFLSFALRHADDFGGSKSITYSNTISRVSITNSKFQARNYSDENQRSSRWDPIPFNVDVVSTCWSGCSPQVELVEALITGVLTVTLVRKEWMENNAVQLFVAKFQRSGSSLGLQN